jgi:benzylsuccinate CoA-transferase BbsF subunit
MESLDLGYETLRAAKHDLVMFSMPAAGLTGPLKDIRTYGLSLTSTTGLDSMTGYRGGPPIPVENAFSDPYNGIMGAFAILCALHHRDRTGAGQHIDYSQQEAVMQMVGPAFMDWAMNGRVAGPIGNRHPLGVAAPHGVFRCAGDDRWVSNRGRHRRRVARPGGGHGRAGVGRGARARGASRAAARRSTTSTSARRLDRVRRTTASSPRACNATASRAAPVLNVADLLGDPHYRARGTFIEVQHPLGFRETIYGAYVKTSRTEANVRTGPRIGQDNDDVFTELLGLPEERYRELVAAQVIY